MRIGCLTNHFTQQPHLPICPTTVGKGIVPEEKTLVHERRAKKGEGKKCQRQQNKTSFHVFSLYLSYN